MVVCAPPRLERDLSVVVDSAVAASSLSPWGDSCPFRNEWFEGTVFFAHRPVAGSGIPFEHTEMLGSRGAVAPLWELQIQGRFLTQPSDDLFFGLELWDGPCELGWAAAAMTRAIFAACGALAKQRGVTIKHSLGSSQGERPRFAFPLVGADRIFVSSSQQPLPIRGSAASGVFEIGTDGGVSEMDRKDLTLDTERFFTFLFATQRLDFSTWAAPTGMPGVGAVDIEPFWGKQAAHLVVFDENGSEENEGSSRYLLEVKLEAPLRHQKPVEDDAGRVLKFLRGKCGLEEEYLIWQLALYCARRY